MQNLIIELNLDSLFTDWFTVGLVLCLVLHLLFTKRKSLVNFCMFLVVVQFINWQLSPWLYGHEHAKYLWYLTWMITDIAILLYVAYRAVIKKSVTKEELAVSVFTTIAIFFYIGRYIERHFTEFSFIKGAQGYALPSVNICILLVLLTPVLKELVLISGKHLNGITIFGLRFSVSSIRSNAVLADPKGISKQKRRIL
ncbi:hypothetical protein GCM10023151_20940 [Kangiella marina]|uniref:Uncharacterized protein n=1 Tax=Kangiella marina TaxID=1079178 RepID=A0ABP8IQ94_9GAMM